MARPEALRVHAYQGIDDKFLKRLLENFFDQLGLLIAIYCRGKRGNAANGGGDQLARNQKLPPQPYSEQP
jgi:hypothetical protein